MIAMPTNERLYGVDIARILAMLLVTLYHVLGTFSGYVQTCEVGRWSWAASACCVDIFALISGYVGVQSQFRLSRFANIWVQTFFTGLVIVTAGWMLGFFSPTLKDWGKVFLPVSSHEYWYVTAYFLLFLISPILNAGLRTLPSRALAGIVCVLVVACVLIPALNPCESDTYSLGHGFTSMWLILCYVFGGTIRRLDQGRVKLYAWLILLGCSLVLARYFCGTYDSPEILLLAVSCFMVCIRLPSPQHSKTKQTIVFLSKAALGVYLWQCQPLVYGKLHGSLHGLIGSNASMAIFSFVGLSVAFYLFVSIFEYLRIKLFDALHVKDVLVKIDACLGV